MFTCWDCGGSGKKDVYHHIDKGVCYTCKGTGLTNEQSNQLDSQEPKASDYCETHGLLGCNVCKNKEELSMSKRQVNEQLFKVIVKIMCDCKNRLDLGKLINYAQEQMKIVNHEYVQMYTILMMNKNMIEFTNNEDEVALTKLACDKYRELKRA